MTTVPQTSRSGWDTPDHQLHSLVQEALVGPELSGITQTVRVAGTVLEASASRGWGLRLTRTLPGGRVEHRHLSDDELTLEHATQACQQLTQLD